MIALIDYCCIVGMVSSYFVTEELAVISAHSQERSYKSIGGWGGGKRFKDNSPVRANS